MDIFSPTGPLVTRIKGQQPQLQPSPEASQSFYRNLEDALDARRTSHTLYSIVQNSWQVNDAVADFSSNDILSLGSSGLLRAEYLNELAQNPASNPGAGGSRLIDGNYTYLEETEQVIASFHGAETALLLASGYEANIAIWTAIPRPGDVILYDALVHASTHDGMDQSLAVEREEFGHNNIVDFRRALLAILESKPLVKQGKRSIIIAVESVYSMDGDVCPLQELVDIAKDVCPKGNAQFVVDEAHSTGVLGPNGAGLVCALGLENEIAVVMHTCGKALSSRGAAILGNKTIKAMLINFAKSIIFTTAPPFAHVALMRAGYKLLGSEQGQEARDQVRSRLEFFLETITSHPLWEEATAKGLLAIPILKDWEEKPLATSHIVTIWTRQHCTYWLYFHLLFAGFCVFPVEHPVVAKNQSRLKVTFHAGNTETQVEGLVVAIYEWVQEMLDSQCSGIQGKGKNKATRAAGEVYAWMAGEKLTGFGMPAV
ncbi:putative aminotransferase [Massariosphaeria phaeospora]|uniref:Putative aminotransferase n=1 Tax=Massariosphaeria phaeospora TaxID=100035 RepID=A0A7C8II61_9PLEO|nr:putative aminotransferase [Massariosphaeria phaeospora]